MVSFILTFIDSFALTIDEFFKGHIKYTLENLGCKCGNGTGITTTSQPGQTSSSTTSSTTNSGLTKSTTAKTPTSSGMKNW